MGKPKALRNRDAIPKIDIDKHQGKRVVFDDESFSKDVNSKKTISSKRKSSDNNSHSESNATEEPEVVSASSAEVLKLKALHEQLQSSLLSKKNKKRKVKTYINSERDNNNSEATYDNDVDKELSEDIFNVIEDNSDEEADRGELINHEEQEMDELEDIVTWRIDKNKLNNVKKFGNIEVSIIDSEDMVAKNTVKNPLAAFPSMSSSAINFQVGAHNRNPRITYASFVSQKKCAPSKRFSKGRSIPTP